jgi:hypothetical protein
LDPATSSALVNLAVLDKGYLALGHLAAADATVNLHPSSEAFSAAAAAHTHRAAFVSDAEGRGKALLMGFALPLSGERQSLFSRMPVKQKFLYLSRVSPQLAASAT